MTTTRWKPRGRIGLRARRKASSDPIGDTAPPDFGALDDSPGFDEVADLHRAAHEDLPALADEIDTRRALPDADSRVAKVRRRSAANPSADRGETATRDGKLPPPETAGRHAATTTSARRVQPATDDTGLPQPDTSHHSGAANSASRHETATGEPARPEATGERADRHSTANTNTARHESANNSLLSPQPATNVAAEASRQRGAAADDPAHDEPCSSPAAIDTTPAAPPGVDTTPAAPPHVGTPAGPPHAATSPAAPPHATTSAAPPQLATTPTAPPHAATPAVPPHVATPAAPLHAATTPTTPPRDTTPGAPPDVAEKRPNPHGDRSTRRREIGGHAAWYLAAGVVTTGLQAVLFLAFRPQIGAQWANLAALAITTVGNTEFHRRVTFANRSSRAGKRHLQDLVTFAFYAGYGSVVLAALDAVVAHPSAGQQTAALLAASFVGGVVRFAVLRWWVFARARRSDAAQDHQG